jgi:DNA polymerase III alpha subunit
MPEPFVHLHLHSHYSLLDSAIKPDELMRQVARLEMPAVALTDHGNLFGAYEFYSAARKAGVRPVLGCEVYVAPGSRTERSGSPHGSRKPYHHLVLLAENQRGWDNLMQLVTTAYLDGFYHRPRIDKELLAAHAEGVIGLSACLSGEVASRLLAGDEKGAARVAEEYREILGRDGFFLEVQEHGLADERTARDGVVRLGLAAGIPLVATNDCHFHLREDVEAHRVLIGIGQNKTVAELARDYAYNDEFYVKSGEEMARLFGDIPDALARTLEIAQRCHVTFPEGIPLLPRYPVPDSRLPEVYIEELARHGLERRLADGRARRAAPSAYWPRLESELGVIHTMGFEGYFLVVWDFIRHAREHGIPVGPGRGSAAGSLVAYALRITDIDPLEYDLLFERFLNPERISMPDIDIDFCQRRRDEVIAHVREVYGSENVSQIATFNLLQARSCIRDVGRVMGMSFAETDRIAKLVPEGIGVTLEDALRDSPRLAEAVAGNPDVGRLIEVGRRLEGLARHCGVHAAGVVIAPRPVREIVPLYRTSRDEVVTQWDKDVIEKLGLLKMDFLGLKTLTVIDDCLRSLAGADTLRKAMGKKIKELIDEQGEHFIAGGVAKGYPKEKVAALWRQIVPFAQYGFNKSHSVAYAYVAYQTAYLKAHFPLHFWAAMLSSEVANTDKLAAYVAQLTAGGVKLLGPDINASQLAFAVEGEAIRVGLGAVKGVGEGASSSIIEARGRSGKFRSAAHLLRTAGERTINRKVVECLVRAGAFDSLHPDRGAVLAAVDKLVDQASRERQALDAGQGFLFGFDEAEETLPAAGTAPSTEELLKGERETLGFYLSGHPLDRWARVLKELRATPVAELPQLAAAGADRVVVGGLVSSLKVRPIKDGRNQGRRMASFTLEDQTGTVRVVAFPDVFERFERSLADGTAVLAAATPRASDGEHVELSLEEATPLEGIEARKAAALRVELDLSRFAGREELVALQELFLRHEGRLQLRLRLVGPAWSAELVPTRVMGVDPATLIPALTSLLGAGRADFVFD